MEGLSPTFTREAEMAGMKFLNPALKVLICALGMTIMGYFLYESLSTGALYDGMTIVRALVFIGFTYLLVKSVADLAVQKK